MEVKICDISAINGSNLCTSAQHAAQEGGTAYGPNAMERSFSELSFGELFEVCPTFRQSSSYCIEPNRLPAASMIKPAIGVAPFVLFNDVNTVGMPL
ncbi:hypothetical protein [Bradyrhizobium sp. UNPF46]|uniref:hypothetical protein n=1 Tax=Bradyrhizobium sp. UNPF46 TaxID=1141168 RepID=UPI0011526936|nr:hypothetical protein [Bradyrhizobium sp. UNPF46]